MGHHLTERGTFKSDKYDWCPEGFFALKFTDPLARLAVLVYAAGTQESELSEDLAIACQDAAEGRADVAAALSHAPGLGMDYGESPKLPKSISEAEARCFQLAEALRGSRGQWIHSIHRAVCESALAAYEGQLHYRRPGRDDTAERVKGIGPRGPFLGC